MSAEKIVVSTDQEITLYSYALSPYAGKVHAFLNFKQQPFKVHYAHPLKVTKELSFTGQHHIPVVQVGSEWRADSTPIGLWLDTLFPDAPMLLPSDLAEREQLLAIDSWVSDSLIAGGFRALIDVPGKRCRQNFRRAAKILDLTVAGGLSKPWQWAWPFLAPRAPFIKALVATLDGNEKLEAMQTRHCEEFIQHLDGGPFFAGRSQPSLPDLAAYHQIVNHYRAGYVGMETFRQFPDIVRWTERMKFYADSLIPILPSQCIVNDTAQ